MAIVINGKTFQGNNISIKDGNIKIDGKPVDVGVIHNNRISVDVTGTLANLSADGDVNCSSISGNANIGGDINCDSIGNSAHAGGDINARTIKGNVHAGGDVNAETISGKVTAGGDVIGRR